mgnify:CR=1 FL=1
MKNIFALLVTSIVFINTMAIMDIKEAQARVDAAQTRKRQIHSEIARLEEDIKRKQDQLQSIAGNPEYAKDFEKRQAEIRSLIEQRNNLLEQHKKATDALSKELRAVSGTFHVLGENGNYKLKKPSYEKPQPIEHRPADMNRHLEIYGHPVRYKRSGY